MIFEISDRFYTKESYKERNLYYKYFAGYFFNELIPGEPERKKWLASKLTSIVEQYDDRFRGDRTKAMEVTNSILDNDVQVTFDFHPAQIIKEYKQMDRGEMSDVLLFAGSSFISIECKYLANMDAYKDIGRVQKRIIDVAKELGHSPLQVLLMKESKWAYSQAARIHYSFYNSFQELLPKVPVMVMFWEDLIEITDNDRVKDYMNKQMERSYKKDILSDNSSHEKTIEPYGNDSSLHQR